jgi:histone acetyltransferase (RNA polymerase elongator complex component)
MPLVIPVFIPHQGCPHCCVFCNQYRISGFTGEKYVSAREVGNIIQNWLKRSSADGREVQVAFYGGSFTGMDRSRQEELLDAVAPYVAEGLVKTVRLSTRPDYIDQKTVSFLRCKNVGIVELGLQSLDDNVLEACQRGHSAEQSVTAVKLLQESGFMIGVQLMLGLPLQTTRSLIQTVKKVAALNPDFVRIYPVLVLQGSILANLYEKGRYKPLSLGAAVAQAARMKKHLDEYGIRIVRIGLQPGPELEKTLVAGPYHPAFGEMVSSRLMLKKTRKILKDVKDGEQVTLTINERDQSMFRGMKSANMKRLMELNLVDRFILRTDASLPRLSVRVTSHSLSLNPETLTR